MMTVNISLPKGMYEDAKKLLKKKHYASVSELVRDSLRKTLYPEVTENGFTREFEDAVLQAAAEPMDNDIVLETEEDVTRYFRDLHIKLEKKRHGKS